MVRIVSRDFCFCFFLLLFPTVAVISLFTQRRSRMCVVHASLLLFAP